MRVRPIIFSGPMVRAILDGRKTQTRRVVKPQPKTAGLAGVYADPYNHGPEWAFWLPDNRMTEPRTWACPYGLPGDRLWVRETWAVGACADGIKPRGLDPKTWLVDNGGLWYPADETVPRQPISPRGRLRPPMFMPRWASRITLEVVGVRVERVREISDMDAVAEGMAPALVSAKDPLGEFFTLWDSINAKRGFPAALNPWVWVIEFKRIQCGA